MIGWLTEQPLFHLYIGTLLTFAALVWLVIGIDKWMERNRTRNKLVFLNVRGLRYRLQKMAVSRQ